jgi:hypothetical protein
LETVRRTALGRHELPDGLGLSFPADAALFVELAEWIGLELEAGLSPRGCP